MTLQTKSGTVKRVSAKFVIGRERFAQISAVEGIELTVEMKKRNERFNREHLSPAQRRKEIIKAYKKA